MADPAKLALMLELQLAAGPALQTLDTIEKKFENIEKIVANIGKATAGAWQAPAEAMAQAQQVVATPAPSVTGANSNPQQALLSVHEWTNALEEQGETLRGALLRYVAYINKQEEAGNVSKTTAKIYRDEARSLLEVSENTRIMSRHMKDMWDTMSAGLGNAGNAIDEIIVGLERKFGAAIIVLGVMNKTLGVIIKEQDEFARANYRAAGSMIDIQMELRRYQFETYASAEAAKKAAQAIYFTGIRGIEAHKTLIPFVIKLTAAYGVSEEAAAHYAGTISAIGGSADDAVTGMEYAAKAIKAAGLSATEATNMFEQLSKIMFTVYALAGKQEAVESFSRGFSTMTALAKDTRVGIDLVQSAMATLVERSPDLSAFLNGANWDDALSNEQLFVEGMRRSMDLMDDMKGMPQGIMRQMVAARTQGKFSLEQITAMALEGQHLNEVFGEVSDVTFGKYRKAIEASADVTKTYGQILHETISGEIQQSLNPILDSFMAILTPAAKLLGFLLTPLVVMGEAIRTLAQGMEHIIGLKVEPWLWGIVGVFIAWKVAMLGPLAKLSLIAGAFYLIQQLLESGSPWLKALGVILTALGTIMLIASIKTGLFGGALKMVTGVGGAATGVFGKLGGLFKKMAIPDAGDGKAGKGFFTTLAEGLKVFAKDSGQILLGALTLSLSIALMMAPIMLFAWMAKEFNIGTAEFVMAIVAFGAAVAAIAILVPILGTVGEVSFAVLPGLLALALGIAALGVAMIPGAYAFKLFGEAAIATFGGLAAIPIMGTVGALAAFAGVSLLLPVAAVAFGLFVLGFGLAVVGFAAAMLLFPNKDLHRMAEDTTMFADAMKKMPSSSSMFDGLKDLMIVLKDMAGSWTNGFFSGTGIGPMLVQLTDQAVVMSKKVGDSTPALKAFTDVLLSFSSVARTISGINLRDVLAGNIVDNETEFKRAADIIDAYSTNVVGSIEAIGDAAVTTAQNLAILHNADSVLSSDTAKVTPVADSKKTIFKMSTVEAREKTLNELQEQTKLLQKLSEGNSNNELKSLLADMINRMDELIDLQRRSESVHPASLWG